MAHDVFISHCTQDKAAADAVCATLEKNGVRCWIAPRDIMPGADWSASIVDAIGTSRVMLLVFSANANASNQIRREVECAANAGVTIVPLRIENVLPTAAFQFFLGNIHWLDALTPPLEKHLQEVAEKVKGILSVGATQPSLVPPKTSADQPPTRRKILTILGGIIAALMGSAAFILWLIEKGTAKERGWTWCRKCQGLFFSGNALNSGVCPADKQAHDGSQSGRYAAVLGEDAPGQQGRWRRCYKCQGMFFSGNRAQGVCPADSQSHDGSQSVNYAMVFDNMYMPTRQGSWRWCLKCQGFFFVGNPDKGTCPAGGVHDASASGWYAMPWE